MKRPMLFIVINPNNVVVEGVLIPRPTRISPSQWMAEWESMISAHLDSLRTYR